MDSRVGPSTNASLVLHAYPWGQQYHVTRFSRLRTTLSVIQIPAERIWYKIKALFPRWPLNQNSHNLFLPSYVLILLGELSWLLKVTLMTWTGESWLLKVTLGSLTWTVNVTIPKQTQTATKYIEWTLFNFAKKYKRVCFLATNKQTGSSCVNRSFFVVVVYFFLLPLGFFFLQMFTLFWGINIPIIPITPLTGYRDWIYIQYQV